MIYLLYIMCMYPTASACTCLLLRCCIAYVPALWTSAILPALICVFPAPLNATCLILKHNALRWRFMSSCAFSLAGWERQERWQLETAPLPRFVCIPTSALLSWQCVCGGFMFRSGCLEAHRQNQVSKASSSMCLPKTPMCCCDVTYTTQVEHALHKLPAQHLVYM